MLEEIAEDYAAYVQLDVNREVNSVQDVVDDMLTRLEELTSVLHMIRTKNSDCASTVTEDICKYRAEITVLVKKINTLHDVMNVLQNNVDILEKKVETAEADFGINNENRIISFLRPFLNIKDPHIPEEEQLEMESVMDRFNNE